MLFIIDGDCDINIVEDIGMGDGDAVELDTVTTGNLVPDLEDDINSESCVVGVLIVVVDDGVD